MPSPQCKGRQALSEQHIVVGLRALKGKEDELRRDLSALVEPSPSEEGNIRYDLFEDRDEPGLFVFVEEWTSAEAQARHHEHGPHIQQFHANGVKNIESKSFAHFLTRIA
jgi:quinol monooxygenase YgiN